MKSLFALLLTCTLVIADPVLQNFGVWGEIKPAEKTAIYAGWTNGFFLGAHDQRAKEFYTCLTQISMNQAIAMIDKYYQQHPERWSSNLGAAILLAMTVSGGPCEGKNPLSN